MRKRDRERWAKQATALLVRLGAQWVDHHYLLAMETRAGLLRLIVEQHDGRKPGGPGTVYARFEDPKRATEYVVCNPFSGKWNHHYFDGWTVEASIDHLRICLEPLHV